MTKKILQQGAEATIYKSGNKVLKERVPKTYRLKILDNKIRNQRTKSEAKILNKLQGIILIPKIFSTSKPQLTSLIHMEYIDGGKLSEHFENLDYKNIAKEIGKTIAKIHDQGIIHGDLTTSNMIYVENPNKENPIKTDKISVNQKTQAESIETVSKSDSQIPKKTQIYNYKKGKVYFIDFGLSFHSDKVEDKAVDLHLLKQALEAKHYKISEEVFNIIIENYKPEKVEKIKKRFFTVERRGRYKDKY